MQTNLSESKFLSIEGVPTIATNKQSIKINHLCGCELHQHFFIGSKDKFPKEHEKRHLFIKFCDLHKQI